MASSSCLLQKTLELITRMFAEEVFGVFMESEQGHSSASLSPLNNTSDDGTLTATVEQPRSRSSASSDTAEFSGFLLSSSLRSDASGMDDGSITEVPETEEYEGGRSDTLKAQEGIFQSSTKNWAVHRLWFQFIHYSLCYPAFLPHICICRSE